jgi:hypothetical protein
MNKGGIGPSSTSKMFTTTIVERSHTLPTMALTPVLGLANINPTPLSLMI